MLICAVVNGRLTIIGGRYGSSDTNTILSLSSDNTWSQDIPPMPTKRSKPACVSTDSYLIVAGGEKDHQASNVNEVEILNTETLQWSIANDPIPASDFKPSMVLCGEYLYLCQKNSIYSCSMDKLLKSCTSPPSNINGDDSMWTKKADLPIADRDSSLATLRGHVLAIGGRNDIDLIASVQCYDAESNSWSVIGQIPHPHHQVLTAVLPSNELLVVGGWKKDDYSYDVYIGHEQ